MLQLWVFNLPVAFRGGDSEVGALAAVSTKPKKDTHPLHRFGQPDSKPFFDHARIKAHFVLELHGQIQSWS